MKRASLIMTIALPGSIALGLNCSADDTVIVPAKTTGGTTTTGSGGQGGSDITTTGTAGDATTTTTSTTGGGEGGVGGSGGEAGSSVGGGGVGGQGGTAGSGGMGGMGGSGGSSPMLCPGGDCRAVFKMDGFLSQDPPDSVSGSDGIQGVGTNGQTCVPSENRMDHGLLFKEAHWKLTGPGITTGTMYKVTFHVVGVIECKTYNTNCTRAPNQGRSAAYNMWCPGATDNGDHWNTFMISITPQSSSTTPGMGPTNLGATPDPTHRFMLNECPAGVPESHKTWMVDHDATITVPGDSFVNFVEFDTNCREIINCGASDDSGTTCTSHYSVSSPALTTAVPPPTGLTMPGAGKNGAYGQWLFFDVKSIAPM